ncbi:MAG: hypothetical protein R3B55_02675 [Candidatus Paceibacterota bacterium]
MKKKKNVGRKEKHKITKPNLELENSEKRRRENQRWISTEIHLRT